MFGMCCFVWWFVSISLPHQRRRRPLSSLCAVWCGGGIVRWCGVVVWLFVLSPFRAKGDDLFHPPGQRLPTLDSPGDDIVGVCFVVPRLSPGDTTGYLNAFDGAALPGVGRAPPRGGRRKGVRGWGPLVGGRPRRLGDGTERKKEQEKRSVRVLVCVLRWFHGADQGGKRKISKACGCGMAVVLDVRFFTFAVQQ